MSVKELCSNLHTSIGTRVEAGISRMGPRMQYTTKVILRLPLIFFAHQWLILAPYSEYTILEMPLLAMRFFAATSMIGCQILNTTTILRIYSTMTIDLLSAWTIELGYWLIQNESTGSCDEKTRLLSLCDEFWWIPLAIITLAQVSFVSYLNYRYNLTRELDIKLHWILIGYLFLHIICGFGYLLFILAPVYFYFYKFITSGSCLVEIMIVASADDRFGQVAQPLRQALADSWLIMDLHRDLHVSFATIYFCTCLLIDGMRLGIYEVLSLKYLASSVGVWTTSSITLLSICLFFEFILNFSVAVSRFLLIGNVNFREAFDENIGGKVYLAAATFSIQCGILSESSWQRSDTMSFILLLMVFIIFRELWDLSEQHFLFLLNTGDSSKWFAYLRVTLFLVFIISGSSYMAYQLAPYYKYDLWAFVNITGVMVLVSRCAFSLFEFGLISLSWHVEDNNDRLADAIYYIRVTKAVVLLLCNVLISYYRIVSPYFAHRFYTTLIMSILECIIVVSVGLKKEWETFQKRRRLIQQINNIPDATEDQLADNEDECSICYVHIESGKILPCGHIFHKDCLKRWFQVKATCPYCNIDVQIDGRQQRQFNFQQNYN